MGKSVVSDFMAFVVDALRNPAELVRLDADQEEQRRSVFPLEDVENLRSPLRIRAVIESDCQLLGTRSVARDPIGLGQRLKGLINDQVSLLIEFDLAFTIGRLGLNTENLAIAFHVDVLPGWNIAQLVHGAFLAGRVPDAPQRTVLGT